MQAQQTACTSLLLAPRSHQGSLLQCLDGSASTTHLKEYKMCLTDASKLKPPALELTNTLGRCCCGRPSCQRSDLPCLRARWNMLVVSTGADCSTACRTTRGACALWKISKGAIAAVPSVAMRAPESSTPACPTITKFTTALQSFSHFTPSPGKGLVVRTQALTGHVGRGCFCDSKNHAVGRARESRQRETFSPRKH